MNRKTHRVLRGFLNLTGSERDELVDWWNSYLKLDLDKRRQKESELRDSENIVSKMAVGPLHDPCPCCGK